MLLFQDIYVINLDRDGKKWHDMQQHLRKVLSSRRLDVHRFRAVDGSALDRSIIQKYTSPFCKNFCPKPVLGCALSHRGIWQMVVDKGLESVCVLEDDVTLDPQFEERLKLLAFEIPNHWDIVYLGCRGACDSRRDYNILEKVWSMIGKVKGKQVSKHVFIPENPAGTYGYIISNQGARKLLGLTEQISFHIDVQIAQHMHQLNAYAIDPKLVYTSTIDSTLATKRPFLLNTLTRNVEMADGTTLSWLMSEPLMSIAEFPISVWQLVYISSGMIASRTMDSTIRSLFYFSIYLLVDEVYGFAFFEDTTFSIGFIGLQLGLFSLGMMI